MKRVTLNRPEKRNALFHPLRGAILDVLREGDMDEDVKVMIVRGNGPSFSAGYDLGGGNEGLEYPHYTAPGEGQWPRHVTESWMSIWDMSKPVIAQVHGYCLAGGSELATGCDLVYMADDAQMGYPAVRFGVPDMHFHPWFLGMRKAMEMFMTGNSVNGIEAARYGWANASFPADELEGEVLKVAEQISMLPLDVLQLNKRAIHRQMEAMGHPQRHPRRHRAVRARHPHPVDGQLRRLDPVERPDRRARSARQASSATTARPTAPTTCRATPRSRRRAEAVGLDQLRRLTTYGARPCAPPPCCGRAAHIRSGGPLARCEAVGRCIHRGAQGSVATWSA